MHILFSDPPIMPKTLGSWESAPQLCKSICEKASQAQPLSKIVLFFSLSPWTVQSIDKRSAKKGDYKNKP